MVFRPFVALLHTMHRLDVENPARAVAENATLGWGGVDRRLRS
jgi:hypothetical protein